MPSVMVSVAAGAAIALLSVDAGRGQEDLGRTWWLNSGGGEDARQLLSTLLTSVIAMASMVFSVTVVALTLAANQYGPRLVRTFRADLRNQVTLGLFAATIVYCLIILRTIEGAAPREAVPHVSVTVGTGLSLVCVMALLGFVQGVARSIVADEIVARVGRDLEQAVHALQLLSHAGPPEMASPSLEPARSDLVGVDQRQEGYVQAVDYIGLVEWTRRHDARVRLDLRPGDFVVAQEKRIYVELPHGQLWDDARETLRSFFVVGPERTPVQDIEFSVRHLVEVAVRALSPGVNDPYTATAVLNRLRGALSELMRRSLPSEVMRDGDGSVRVVRTVSTYAGILDAALNQIRQAGAGMPAVTIHMLEAIARVSEQATLPAQVEALRAHVRKITTAALRATPDQADREDIERSSARASAALVDAENRVA